MKAKENKIEPPSIRQSKIKRVARKLVELARAHYDVMSAEQKETVFTKMDLFDERCEKYMKYEIPWDSELSEQVIRVNDRDVKATLLTTHESVMDAARDVFTSIPIK